MLSSGAAPGPLAAKTPLKARTTCSGLAGGRGSPAAAPPSSTMLSAALLAVMYTRADATATTSRSSLTPRLMPAGLGAQGMSGSSSVGPPIRLRSKASAASGPLPIALAVSCKLRRLITLVHGASPGCIIAAIGSRSGQMKSPSPAGPSPVTLPLQCDPYIIAACSCAALDGRAGPSPVTSPL